MSKKFILNNQSTSLCDNVKAQFNTIDILGGRSNACLVDFNNDGRLEKVMFSGYDWHFSLNKKFEYQTTKLEPTSQIVDKNFRREAIIYFKSFQVKAHTATGSYIS